jgi:hypothetical protein
MSNGADEYTAATVGLCHIGEAVLRVLTRLGPAGKGMKTAVPKGRDGPFHAGCWRGPNLQTRSNERTC